jgi:hypothetical protein
MNSIEEHKMNRKLAKLFVFVSMLALVLAVSACEGTFQVSGNVDETTGNIDIGGALDADGNQAGGNPNTVGGFLRNNFEVILIFLFVILIVVLIARK